MRLRYIQPLADILRRYDDLYIFSENNRRVSLEHDWGVDPDDPHQMARIAREREALRYLVNCSRSWTTSDLYARPEMYDLSSALRRHLSLLVEHTGLSENELKRHGDPLMRKQALACTHYLFQLTLPAFVASLPDVGRKGDTV